MLLSLFFFLFPPQSRETILFAVNSITMQHLGFHVAVLLSVLFFFLTLTNSLPTASKRTATTPKMANQSNITIIYDKNQNTVPDLQAGETTTKPFKECRRRRKNFTLTYPHQTDQYNCSEGVTKLPYCVGGCTSITTVNAIMDTVSVDNGGLALKDCNCCSFLHADVTSRKVSFNCTDYTKDPPRNEVKNVTMYFPKIMNCTCVKCGAKPYIIKQ